MGRFFAGRQAKNTLKSRLLKIKNLALGQTARSIYLVTLGNGLTSLLGLVAIILVSRQLGPTQFGLFSLTFGVFMTASKFTDLGVNFALSRYTSRHDKGGWEYYARYALFIKLALTVASSVLGIIFAPYISNTIFHNNDLTILLRLSFISLFGIMFFDYYTTLANSLKMWISSICLQSVAGLFKIVILVLLVIFSHFTVLSSILAYLASPIIGAIVGFWLTPRNYLKHLSIQSEHKEQVLRFSSWMGIAVLVGSVSGNLDIFMVGNKLTAFDVGIYSAASRLSQIVTVITASIGTVLSIRSSSLVDPAHKKKFLRKTLSLGSGIFVIAALSWVISESLVRLTVGDSFVGSAAVFKILLFVAVLGAVQTTINSNFYGLEKPQYFAFSSIVTSTVVFVSNTLLIPRFGSLGAAYSNLISAGALLLFSLIFLKFSAVSLFRKTKHTD